MFLPELKSKQNEDISILVKLDNHSEHYICECGEASKLSVKDCQNAKAIFISHLHIDHFINFDTILRHQLGTEQKVHVFGPLGILKQLQAKVRAYTWNLIEKGSICYEIWEVLEPNLVHIYKMEPPNWDLKFIGESTDPIIYQNERFQVSCTILDHKIHSIAYLFKERDAVKIDIQKSEFKGGKWVRDLKNAFEAEEDTAIIEIEGTSFQAKELYHLLEIKKGDSLGIIMDHAPSKGNHQKIKQLFQNCDKVFIESFYKAADKEFALTNFHSYSTQSGKIMRESQVKEAIPVHFSRRYEEEEIEELIGEFEKAFKG